jgi:hypothetical protein
LPGFRQHARLERGRPHGRGLATILRAQAGEPFRFEPVFPPGDVRRIAADGRRDRRERLARSQHQDDLRAARIFRPNLAAARPLLQFSSFIGCQCQRHMALQFTTTDSVVTVH